MLLIGATALFSILIFDQQLTFIDGTILLSALIFILYLLSRSEEQTGDSSSENQETNHSASTNPTLARIIIGVLTGLIILLASSKLVVWSATEIAQQLGVSDLVIGLTIVALGTSLPELATCIASAMKKHADLAVGNIVGSNIFNTLGVTATASLITNYSLPEQIFSRDYPAMILTTGVLFILLLIYLRKKHLPRKFGLLFLAGYAAYMYTIYIQT
jgi:cation:H+ antiporter